MTKSYHVGIEVQNIPKDKEKEIADIISDMVNSTDDMTLSKNRNGTINLECADETSLNNHTSEKEAHEQFKKEVLAIAPNAKIITRWHFSEWTWENEFEN